MSLCLAASILRCGCAFPHLPLTQASSLTPLKNARIRTHTRPPLTQVPYQQPPRMFMILLFPFLHAPPPPLSLPFPPPNPCTPPLSTLFHPSHPSSSYMITSSSSDSSKRECSVRVALPLSLGIAPSSSSLPGIPAAARRHVLGRLPLSPEIEIPLDDACVGKVAK